MKNDFNNDNSSYFDNLTQENRQDKYFDDYGKLTVKKINTKI